MKIRPALWLLLMFCLINNKSFCQNYWKYPIVPGTPEWKELKTINEKIAVQQIPENILKKMPTEQVFQAWIDLPGRMELLAFNSMQEGFNKTRIRYNVLNELLARKDAGTIALNNYMTLSPNDLKSEWDSKRKGKFITEYAFLEFFLSQPEILINLSADEKNMIFKKAKQHLESKMNAAKENYDNYWISSGIILAARILEKESPQFQDKIKSNKMLMNGLKRGEVRQNDEFEVIYKSVNEINY